MIDFLRWLWSEPPLMLIVLGLMGICVQVARMVLQEKNRPDASLASSEAEQLAVTVEREAREVEKLVNGALRADVRKEYLRLFWSYHDKVLENLRRCRLGNTLDHLILIAQIEDRIIDGIEKGKLVDDCNGVDIPATVASISRNYCDRVMRLLAPHLRVETLRQVSAVTGYRIDSSGRKMRPGSREEEAARPSARDAFRKR